VNRVARWTLRTIGVDDADATSRRATIRFHRLRKRVLRYWQILPLLEPSFPSREKVRRGRSFIVEEIINLAGHLRGNAVDGLQIFDAGA
jgi:hypothetical protein